MRIVYAKKIVLLSLLFVSGLHGMDTCHYPQRSSRVLKTIRWFNEMTPESKDWHRLSVRNIEDPLTNPNYLPRLYHATFEIFKPWFDSSKDDALNELPFLEILKQQHIEMVLGKDGGAPYNGATLLTHGYSDNIFNPPGKFRHEIKDLYTKNHTIPFKMSAKFQHGPSERIKKLIQDYNEIIAEDKMIGPTEVLPVYFTGDAHASIDVQILPDVDLKFGIVNEIYSDYIKHNYPDPSQKDEILKAMSRKINTIKKLAKNNPQNSSKALKLIEEYLYLGIHVHAFNATNFSIFMAQTNFMLSRFGIKGISSSNLDWVGLSEQLQEFREIFRGKLREENSIEIPRLKERSIGLNLLAHIQDLGDRFFAEGQLIENKEDAERKRIEGIKLYSALPKNVEISYMGRVQGKGDLPWTPARTFLGTKGESLGLEGLAFKIFDKEGKSNLSIRYMVRMGDSLWTQVCKDGEYCGVREPGMNITALKVWLEEEESENLCPISTQKIKEECHDMRKSQDLPQNNDLSHTLTPIGG